MDSIVKWEYKILPVGKTEEFERNIVELGQSGWEGIAYVSGTGFVLKRPCGEIAITKHISQERNQTDYDGYER